MSLKAELETWAAALKAYDAKDFETALLQFSKIADASKILFNIALIYATLGEHQLAIEQFENATSLDQYLAVAYFQCGVSNFLLTQFDLAYKDFNEALLHLRGNQDINYEQLGLKFKLFAAEVLFNKGLSLMRMGRLDEGLAVMAEAQQEKTTEEHNVIDEAIADRGEGYTVFSIPVGVLYRPSESKLRNAKAKDYLGKARLVATVDENEQYTTFTGVTRLKQGISPSNVYLEGASSTTESTLSRANTVAITSRPTVLDESRPQPTLQRAKTTINVPANARERVQGGGSSFNQASTKEASPQDPYAQDAFAATSFPAPTRSLSLASRGDPPGSDAARVRVSRARVPAELTPAAVAPPNGGRWGNRNEQGPGDFYDDYIDSYSRRSPPVSGGSDRARTRSVYNGRSPPVSAPVRRRTTRRGPPPPRRSVYEEEEEGYGSGGDYDEFEMTKIRIKLHYQDDVRGMAIDASVPFDEFVDRLAAKFDTTFTRLQLKFKDEDGGKVTLRDESDYELAIETARESAKGKPEGRLEVWCTDI